MSTSIHDNEYQALVYTLQSLNGILGTEDVDDSQGPMPYIQSGLPTVPLSLNHSDQPDFTIEVGGKVQASDNLNANLSIDLSLPELGPSPWGNVTCATDEFAMSNLFFGAQSPVQVWSCGGVSTGHPADISPTTPSTFHPLDPLVLESIKILFEDSNGRELDGGISQDAIQDHSTNKGERTIQEPRTDSAVNAQAPQSNIESGQVNTSPSFSPHLGTLWSQTVSLSRVFVQGHCTVDGQEACVHGSREDIEKN
ncbi:hypothetical protein K435DRAFT_804934 [Dendrothele bispora CBS 962.96]|uniref:Uncharacterized protein n=1 Tax=Dendrothele bispora (strain CBS 962.96) TaxID=1314807 RepID=A0A4S8LDD9_DENBC|nr:hypothetical protein K435DRAFT_804934 [Dendrothele bispora CBS 962.96]